MIYLLTAIRLPAGGSTTVHIYTQTIHRKTQNKKYMVICLLIMKIHSIFAGACGSAGSWGTTVNWKVWISIPDGVIGYFHGHNPFGRAMILRSTQSLTEMSTRNISWGVKAGLRPTSLPSSCTNCLEIWSLNLLESSEPIQACTHCFTFTVLYSSQ
jgi:hypothetical protein